MNGFFNEHIFRTRAFKLYLPPSYHRRRGSFPCVYVQDGGSLFEEQIECLEEKFHHGKLPELIIAGIEPKNRLNEYTPWPAASLHEAFDVFGGKGDQYLSEIIDQLIPYIEENWNIDGSPQTRGFIGSSLGGLISMFALLKHPHMFETSALFPVLSGMRMRRISSTNPPYSLQNSGFICLSEVKKESESKPFKKKCSPKQNKCITALKIKASHLIICYSQLKRTQIIIASFLSGNLQTR